MFRGTFTRMSWLTAILALGLMIFAFAGCSDDDDNDDPVGPTIDEDAPELTAPNDGADIDLKELSDMGESFTLDWEPVDMADGYRVQIAPDNGFGATTLVEDFYQMSFVDEDDVNDNGDEDEVLLYDYYEPQVNKWVVGNTYFWRVATVWDDGTETGWSEVRSFTPFAEAKSVDEILEGVISSDKALESGKTYLLRGGVFVGSDNPNATEVTLSIPPNVTIYGESATEGMLVIRRSGRIEAEGTANAPIVFTSDKAEGSRGRGDWGGVIINGEATLNTGAEAYGEGDTGPYGGTNDADDSGILRYVRIEFAGREISPDNELNGLALQGVGSGTEIDYVQVHMNKDDGIEFFGGTASAKHVFITGCADDQFDWTDGWRGMGQYWICQQYADDADQGIEADSNADDNSATPKSMPMISNLTLIGAGNGNGESDLGMLLREGTGAYIYNAVVMNFGEFGIDIDQDATWDNAENGDLVVDYSVFFNNAIDKDGLDWSNDDDEIDEEDFISDMMTNNWFGTDPDLMDAANTDAPNFTPNAGSILLDADNAMDPTTMDAWFDQAMYIGGMGDGFNWIEGWTTSDKN